MMCNFKLFLVAILLVSVVICDALRVSAPGDNQLQKGGRKKRLLFYDEEGNLVKTYKNPHLYNFAQTAENSPILRNFLNPLLGVMRQSYGGPTTYMIPVSEEVIQQISRDPMYQNRVLTVPRKELVVEPNTKCEGKRTQLMTSNCRNFLNCWDGWGFEQECPEGLMFSREGYCDYPQNVDCSSRTTPSSTQMVASPSPSQPMPMPPSQPTASPPSPAVVPVSPPANPVAPAVIPVASPVIPVAPAVIPVASPAIPIPPAVIPVSPVIPASPPIAATSMQCSKDFESFRSTTQCSEFFVCVDKVPIRFRCPADLYFNQELGVCDYAYRVNCNDSVVVQAADIVMQSRPVPCVGEPSDPPQPKVTSSVFNSQSWSSHVAISRQDAVRQLQFRDNKL